MKECPSCKALCFEDMEVCFGCLHRFDEIPSRDERPSVQMARALSESPVLGKHADGRQGLGRQNAFHVTSASEGVAVRCEDAPVREVLIRDEWALRVEAPEGGDGLVIRLGRASR